jgi:hypothetical protein
MGTNLCEKEECTQKARYAVIPLWECSCPLKVCVVHLDDTLNQPYKENDPYKHALVCILV